MFLTRAIEAQPRMSLALSGQIARQSGHCNTLSRRCKSWTTFSTSALFYKKRGVKSKLFFIPWQGCDNNTNKSCIFFKKKLPSRVIKMITTIIHLIIAEAIFSSNPRVPQVSSSSQYFPP